MKWIIAGSHNINTYLDFYESLKFFEVGMSENCGPELKLEDSKCTL